MTNYRPLSEERVACVIDKVIHRSLESYEEQDTLMRRPIPDSGIQTSPLPALGDL